MKAHPITFNGSAAASIGLCIEKIATIKMRVGRSQR